MVSEIDRSLMPGSCWRIEIRIDKKGERSTSSENGFEVCSLSSLQIARGDADVVTLVYAITYLLIAMIFLLLLPKETLQSKAIRFFSATAFLYCLESYFDWHLRPLLLRDVSIWYESKVLFWLNANVMRMLKNNST